MKVFKNIIKPVMLFLLSILTLIVFYRSSPNINLQSVLTGFNWLYLVFAVVSFIFYLVFETLAFRYLLKSQGYRVPFGRIFGYTLHDFFFSSITPGGSGGQPGQFYAMQRDKIPHAHCLTTLFTFNAVYHTAMLLIALWAMVVGATLKVAEIPTMKWLIAYGIGAQVLFVVVLSALLLSKNLLPKALCFIFGGVRHIPFIKRLGSYEEKLHRQCNEYRASGALIKKNPVIFIKAFGYILPMLFFLYAIPYCLYRGLGYNTLGLWQMVALQSVAVIALESIPLPGSVGLGEVSLTAVYGLILPLPQAFALMFLTRALHLYFGLLISGIGVMVMGAKPVMEKMEPSKNSKDKKLIIGIECA